MINEGDKIKLTSGEIAIISEVLEKDVAYIAEIFLKDGGVSIDQICHNDIASIFEEIERPIAQAI